MPRDGSHAAGVGNARGAAGAGRPAVFLDRDDTLIENRAVTAHTKHLGSLFDPELVRLLPGVAGGLRRLKEAGFLLVVVSNQGCVARGEATVEQVEATNRRVEEVVRREAGVGLDAVYYCPWHPGGTVSPWNVEHLWRKPAPGMVVQAVRDLGIDVGRSWMVGDAERDVEAGIGGGIDVSRTILVGEAECGRLGWRVGDVGEAAGVILRAARGRG